MLLLSTFLFASPLLLTLLLLLASLRLLLGHDVSGMSAVVGVPFAANTSAGASVTLLLLVRDVLGMSTDPGVPLIAITHNCYATVLADTASS